jgi:hypothetical protein
MDLGAGLSCFSFTSAQIERGLVLQRGKSEESGLSRRFGPAFTMFAAAEIPLSFGDDCATAGLLTGADEAFAA